MNATDHNFAEKVVVTKAISKEKNKAIHGAFIVNLSAVLILLENKATAMQICALLTLACFTKQNHGKYHSTASYNALMNRLGIGKSKAIGLIDDLNKLEYKGIRLLELPETEYELREEVNYDDNGEEIGYRYIRDYGSGPSKDFISRRGKYSLIRWELPRKHYKDIWLDKDLVGKGRSEHRPLKLLWRLCGDIAARLYLVLCYYNYLETDIIHPSLLSYDYEIQEVFEDKGIRIMTATRLEKLPYIIDSVLRLVIGDGFSHSKDSYTHNIFEALNALERNGFIYRSVLVSLAAANSDVVSNYYELDCKVNNKSKYNGSIVQKKVVIQ